jgi:NADH dehydrogenase
MTDDWVTVFGGSGFLGRRLVQRLAGEGRKVRLVARRPERAALARPPGAAGEIVALKADLRDEASLGPALEGASAVVNAVGLYVERGASSFEAVHVAGAAALARRARQAGVARLVLISGIGADPASRSAYVRVRAEGEAAVRAAFPEAVILRPSVLFGPEDAFFNSLAAILRLSPVIPLFGRGETRLQPVFVGDVAEALARVLRAPEAAGRTYELGGPQAYSYRALLELVLAQIGRRRLLLPLPFFVWDALARLSSPLPTPPITEAQVELMRHDNLVAPGTPGFAELGIAPQAVEAILPSYLAPG